MKLPWNNNGRICEEWDEGTEGGGSGEYFSQAPDNQEPENNSNSGGIDYEKLAQANAAAFRNNQPQQVQQTPPLSEEDFNKLVKKWTPDEGFVQTLHDPAATPQARTAAYQQMVANIYQHIYTTVGMLNQNQQKEYTQALSPLQEHYREQQVKGFKDSVFKEFPVLKQHGQMVDMALTMMRTSGYQPTSAAQAKKDLALFCEQQLKTVNPQFSLKTQNQQQNPRGMPQMAGMTSGGNSSGGGRNNQQAQKAWAGVFSSPK